MPTVGSRPSLEATQAVGAILLHRFAQERFVQARIDESLINEAENRARLNDFAGTLLHDDTSNGTSTSFEVLDDTNNESDGLETNVHNNTSATSASGQQNLSGSLNGSSIIHNGEENFLSIMSDSAGQNATGTPTQQDRTVYHSMNASNHSTSPYNRLRESPTLEAYGKELRRIADEFEKSRLRMTVKERADQVNLSDITKESFVKLLEELFQEKITREKIVILFFFCTDVAVRAAKYAQDLVIELMGWSFSYIINTVCSFIHKLGGWDKVLFYQLPSILISCCAALAIVSLAVYLKRNLLRAP